MMNFNDRDIRHIYFTKVKLPDSYFKKYEDLPPCPSAKYNFSWVGKDYPRVGCVMDFKEWMSAYNLTNVGHLAYTSNEDPELDFISGEQQTLLNYPPYDLHTFDHVERYDFFLFNQTLEHLHNPFLAVQNIYRSLKPGGYVFTSVPTLNIPHMMPSHFNGFTPMGLAMLFKNCQFEVMEIGQWGNCDYIQSLFETHSWPDYQKLQKNGKITNEERNVCQCWILARKPLRV
jgi:SAM-dependent methyltransferase